MRFPPRADGDVQQLAERLDLSLATMYEEALEAGTKWTDDPQACVARELAMVRPPAPATTRARAAEGIRGSGAIHELDSPSVAPPTSLHVSM